MLSNVQSSRYFFYFLFFSFTLSLSSCNDDDDDDDTPPVATPATVDFGAAYSIVQGETNPGGIELPVLAGDSVLIRVAYSGCNPGHEFEFETRLLSSTRAEIWLKKTTEDESCAAFFTSDESFRVPFDVLAREDIFLLGPDYYSVNLR